MKKRTDDDFAHAAFNGPELHAVVQALAAQHGDMERNRAVALRMNRTRLVEHYTLCQQMARAALEICRLALQTAEDAAEQPPATRHTPASGPLRVTPEIVTSTRSVAMAMVVDYARRYGGLGEGPRPPFQATRAAQKELDLLEPEGSC